MDKAVTKRMLAGRGIALLPDAVVSRPATGLVPDKIVLEDALRGMTFPVIVKPAHLGSSIGVAKAETPEEVRAVLPSIFKFDSTAIIEPSFRFKVIFCIRRSRLVIQSAASCDKFAR